MLEVSHTGIAQQQSDELHQALKVKQLGVLMEGVTAGAVAAVGLAAGEVGDFLKESLGGDDGFVGGVGVDGGESFGSKGWELFESAVHAAASLLVINIRNDAIGQNANAGIF
jgi:hypothetical protein